MLRYCLVAVAVLLASASFGDDQPAPGPPADDTLSPSFTWGEVPPATGNAGLSGVYHKLGLVRGTMLRDTVWQVVSRLKHTYWCFFPDGRCYYSMPAEGLDNFNYDYVRPMNELWCCTYKLEGDKGVITWGTGGTTVPFRRAGKTLLIRSDTDVYELLDPGNGLPLEGTYRRYDWQEEYSSKQGITFSRDGTFVDEGFLGGAMTTWWWADRGLVDAKFPPGKGTYRVANTSLVLRYADGRKLRANFHLGDRVTKDDVTLFVVNTRRFVKVK
jgi:hypothetical protein